MKTIRTGHGKARMPAHAAALVRPVRAATLAMRTPRPDCRKVLRLNSTRRAGVISDKGWKRKFEDPIPLPRGGLLVTLQDADTYITKLPKAEHMAPE